VPTRRVKKKPTQNLIRTQAEGRVKVDIAAVLQQLARGTTD
jgi:hypothetical protein